jgi:uncharacterized protein (TIGR03435 family)
MSPRVALVASVLATSATLVGQQVQAPQAAFDVVSIKPNLSSAVGGGFRVNATGRVEWTNTTLRALLRMAYQRFGFDPREIVGGPAWIDSERFDVIATPERPSRTGANGFPEELLGMIRALVEDRFKVRIHNEQRDAAIYALVLARPDGKTGASLHPVPDACAEAMKAMTERTPRSGPPPCSFGTGAGKLIGTGVTLTMFGHVLSGFVGRNVVDRTGLNGSFDIQLTYDPASAAKALPGAPPGPTTADDTAPSIFTALQEQLGLKLESTRGLVDVLVIDSAERPTPN